MITNIKILKSYCSEYTQIENYAEAVKSPLKYDLHHRLEISENKSRKDLIAENFYYGRHPEELIFLEQKEHRRLHLQGKHLSQEVRQKISEAMKGKPGTMLGKPSPWLGKHPSEEARQKMSAAKKGKHPSEEARKKMSDAKKGKHWHVENGKHVYTE